MTKVIKIEQCFLEFFKIITVAEFFKDTVYYCSRTRDTKCRL